MPSEGSRGNRNKCVPPFASAVECEPLLCADGPVRLIAVDEFLSPRFKFITRHLHWLNAESRVCFDRSVLNGGVQNLPKILE